MHLPNQPLRRQRTTVTGNPNKRNVIIVCSYRFQLVVIRDQRGLPPELLLWKLRKPPRVSLEQGLVVLLLLLSKAVPYRGKVRRNWTVYERSEDSEGTVETRHG